jgi:hypothetical protein
MPRPDCIPPAPAPARARAAATVSMTDRMMRCTAALSVTAAAVVTALTFAVALPPAPASAAVDASGATNGVCPTLTAGAWQLPYAPYTKGTVYDVKVNGYACAKADAYVKKLVTNKVSNGGPTTVKGGPRGWTCTASKSKTGLAYTGQCSKKFPSIGGPFFAWSVG